MSHYTESVKVKCPFRLEQEIKDALTRKAQSLGHTRSAYLRFLVERDLTESENPMKAKKRKWIVTSTFAEGPFYVYDATKNPPEAPIATTKDEASANLIAAAPELLDAIEAHFDITSQLDPDHCPDLQERTMSTADVLATMKRTRAHLNEVIAKAKGGVK